LRVQSERRDRGADLAARREGPSPGRFAATFSRSEKEV
jgi:hypothetical protein